MQLARVQAALEHSTHASEALASAGQATHPRAARASLSPTRTTRPGRPARRSALPDLSCRPVPPRRSRCRAPSMATRMLAAPPVVRRSTHPLSLQRVLAQLRVQLAKPGPLCCAPLWYAHAHRQRSAPSPAFARPRRQRRQVQCRGWPHIPGCIPLPGL